MQSIPLDQFNSNVFQLFDKNWFLLTSGDLEKGDFNTMTISWGYLGIMWNRPTAVAAVRPVRHTFQFMEKYDSFTLSAFPEKYRYELNLLGSVSGRDGDKISDAGLTVIASKNIAAPTFAEAELVIECKKMYWHDYDPTHFLDPGIENSYPKKDYHRVYYGQIQHISGVDKFKR